MSVLIVKGLPCSEFVFTPLYSVMQSDHAPTTLEQHNLANSQHIITFAKHENGRIGVFRMKMRALVQKL